MHKILITFRLFIDISIFNSPPIIILYDYVRLSKLIQICLDPLRFFLFIELYDYHPYSKTKWIDDIGQLLDLSKMVIFFYFLKLVIFTIFRQ